MKKILKWVSIIVGSLIGLLIIAAVALPFFLPLEKIKDMATEKISEAINREVKIEKISFNIFSGVKLEKLSVSNRKGYAKNPFVSADVVELRYAFWPIFKRQIIVKEVRLVKPEILVEKNSAGIFNFSDLTKKKAKKPAKKEKEEKKEKKKSFSLIVDTFSIRKARITYADYVTKQTSEIKNADLRVSGITLSMLKPIGLKFNATASYKGKDIPLSLATKIGLDLKKQKISVPSLALSIAGEKVNLSANVSNWKTGLAVDFSLSSNKLSLDTFLAVLSGGAPKEKKKLAPGELTKKVDKATAKIKSSYNINGNINVENVMFKEFSIEKIDLSLSLANKKAGLKIKEIALYDGKLSGTATVDLRKSGLSYDLKDLKLEGFNSTPLINDIVSVFLTKLPDYEDLKDKVYGKLSVGISLSGNGVETKEIFANAVGDGSFKLVGAEIKKMKIMTKIAETIKSNSLKEDMKFKDINAAFSIKNRVLTAKNLKFYDKDIQATFNGSVDLANLKWVEGNRLVVKVSPALSQGIPSEFNMFRDENGWFELTFEITGSLKAPLPKPILDKVIEKTIGNIKLQIEAKTIELEKQAQEELQKKEEEVKATLAEEQKKAEAAVAKAAEEAKKAAEEEAARIAEEAKKAAEEEAKKQLRNIIKF